MVVHQDHGAFRQLQRPTHDLARIDRGMVDGAVVHHLVGDQLVLLVEEEDAELLARGVGEAELHIVEQLAPRGDHRPLADRRAPDARADLGQQLRVEGDGLADAGHAAQLGRRGGQHPRERAEPGQQRLGQRLDVAARDRAEQLQFEQFVVGQGGELAAGALAQPLAVAVEMRPRRFDRARRRGRPEVRLRGLGKVARSVHAERCSSFVRARQSAWTGGLKRPAGEAVKIS